MHERSFSTDDAYRAIDSTHRLLTAVSAFEAAEAEEMKMERLRRRLKEQARHVRRRGAKTALRMGITSSVPAWRIVVVPHPDVASGGYKQTDFAAGFWQVYRNEGSPEYRDPAEFFHRTYLTESLRAMLVGAVTRLTSGRGDPVIQLQPKRLHGSVSIDPVRAGKVVGQITEEVVVHLTSPAGCRVEVTLEIEAEIPDGAPKHVVRTVTENARTLDFRSQGFEE